jgi:hypothetical protein
MLFDTGGGTTLVTPAVAARLGCRPYGADTGHRMTGEPVVAARCDSIRMSAVGWAARLAPVAVLDVNALLPPELPRLDGVLALDAFRGQVLTIDWGAGVLRVHGAASADSALRASGVIYRAATGQNGGELSAMARVEGRRGPLWFLLDSGNLRGTLVASAVMRDSLIGALENDRVLLEVGGRPPIELPYSVSDLVLDGALGTDYFVRGAVTLDLRHVRP